MTFDEWNELWERAHRDMAPWDRRPSPHLIDGVLGDPDRCFLRYLFAEIAGTTHMLGGFAHRANVGRLVWVREFVRPDTMETVTVRVVLEHDGVEIVTAFLA